MSNLSQEENLGFKKLGDSDALESMMKVTSTVREMNTSFGKMENRTKLSVVVAEYKGASMMDELLARIGNSLEGKVDSYEVILVNDCSPDNTWECMKRACARDSRVKGVNLSRNFGENYAITAGLRYAEGDWVIVMDCDLQNRPEDLPALIAKAREGYDIVYARRTAKQFSVWRRLSSRVFHTAFQWLSGIRQDSAVAEFGIYSRKVIDQYNLLPECARSFSSLVSTLGFRSASVDVQHAERGEGESSYTLAKLFHLASDVIISNSNKPLKIAVAMGTAMVLFSLVLIVYSLIEHFCISVPRGFSSTFISIWFVGGMNIFILGIVGLYVGRIFDQVKGRPLFIVSDTLNI